MKDKDIIKQDYILKKDRIRSKLNEFKNILNSTDEQIFEELAFCILTANTSAKMSLNSIEAAKPFLINGTAEDITKAIKGKYIYYNVRPKYIVQTREYLKKEINFKIKDKIASFKDKNDLRNFFAENKNIKGLGFKESSHFLRNIGITGYAILDKHIINTMFENNIILTNQKPKNKTHYLELEKKYMEFAKKLNIDPDELDLLLWSRKNGQIIK